VDVYLMQDVRYFTGIPIVTPALRDSNWLYHVKLMPVSTAKCQRRQRCRQREDVGWVVETLRCLLAVQSFGRNTNETLLGPLDRRKDC